MRSRPRADLGDTQGPTVPAGQDGERSAQFHGALARCRSSRIVSRIVRLLCMDPVHLGAAGGPGESALCRHGVCPCRWHVELHQLLA
jgi:hypothetical protein